MDAGIDLVLRGECPHRGRVAEIEAQPPDRAARVGCSSRETAITSMPRCTAWLQDLAADMARRAGDHQCHGSSHRVIMSATRTGAPVCAERVIASVVASVIVPPRPLSTGASMPRITLAKLRICS